MKRDVNDLNLIIMDMEQFISKYTRFMSKNIYISLKMYELFFQQYDYLYEILEKEKLLYSGNLLYQKVMNFKKNKEKFVRLHNVKYLKRRNLEYQDFFDELYSKDVLDSTKRNVILCEEEEMLFITSKNQIPLVVAKIEYLVRALHYSLDRIMVFVSSKEEFLEWKKELKSKGLEQVNLVEGPTYLNSFLKEEETLLEEGMEYNILRDYFLYELFPDKGKFIKFYQEFGSYLYLNKDYKEFDTFRDYHNYMYKRKYLSTGLSLKRYIEKEVGKRRNYLRTICNEVMNTKQEVDVANFLYLNSVPYQYCKEDSSFLIEGVQPEFAFCYRKGKQMVGSEQGDKFSLYEYDSFGKKALEVLIYELIKRRIPMEKRGDEEVYEKLKETSRDGYFRDFIMNHLMSMIHHYEVFGDFSNTKLSLGQKDVLMDVIAYYRKKVLEAHLIGRKVLYERVSEDIERSKYQYVILLGEEKLEIKGQNLRILNQYKEIPFIRDHIQLSLECRKYLEETKLLVPLHCFVNMQEYFSLSNAFLKKNLGEMNQNLAMNRKKISIYFYSDENRLLIPKEISELSCQLVSKRKEEDILIGVNKKSDINLLIGFSEISKLEENTLLFLGDKKVSYEEISKIKKPMEVVLLPHLIMDSYHENLLDQYYDHHLKMTVLTLLGKCRKELWMLCPVSKAEFIKKFFVGVKNVEFYEDVV